MSRRKKTFIAATVAAVSGTLVVGIGVFAQADLVNGTVTAGQGRYITINHRSQPSTSSPISGTSRPGDKVTMSCRTAGDIVENNSQWIWSGSYYIAGAFIQGNVNSLPACGSTAPTTPAPAGAKTLTIGMQKQVRTQWCWDASGVTIANYWGRSDVTQEQFCRLAAQGTWVDCNNQPAALEDMANGLARLGLSNSGRSLARSASFNETTGEITAGRPFAVRIGWRTGGGHMNVIYGYDSSSNMIAVGDPWPTTQTYTWWNYARYASNSSFQWTHSRIGIHG
ncbi:papain-like cysteine protease family protein [Kitasatospora aureofaciens]|uniref:papain-like cysteine protease family protein n=1 Tax=Kitasatospora aureofaciens TaxID=1894 RepID=UPI001C446125|nr:papain-like cysteine protease family protein [Kitasatospora aureofaciens]MBV6699895.1 C39 family peptidase [Kitasatospora aureofaciens]